jgi:hypothetical protein
MKVVAGAAMSLLSEVASMAVAGIEVFSGA